MTTPTSGGVNNIVQYVNTADGHRYVLRIYNNGNKTEKVGPGWDVRAYVMLACQPSWG